MRPIKENLTSNQWAVYEMLAIYGPMKNSEIQRHLPMLSIESIAQACKSMYRFGFIKHYDSRLLRMKNGRRVMSHVWCVNVEEETEVTAEGVERL